MIRIKFHFKQFGYLVLLLCIASCSNMQRHLSKEAQSWDKETLPTSKIKHTIFLIGDAGDATTDKNSPALNALKLELEKASENSSVIFLGDNIYPVGMPPKSEKEDRKIAEDHIDAQLNVLKDYKGQSIFLPGNHDWYRYGIKGLHRQEKYIEKHLNKDIEDEEDWNNHFLPDDACSGPEVIEVNDQLVIIVIDSNWFLLNWDKYPNISDGCEIKSRKDFAAAFNSVIRANKSKNILVAMHHPIQSNGIHGGHPSTRSHLFPIPGKGKYIPLPVLGTLAGALRAMIGSRQDITSNIYQELIESVLEPAKDNGHFVFAAGHEHNLQYFKDQESGQHLIVSGSGSKKTPTVPGHGASFSYGSYGFSKIDYYEDGSSSVEFWTADEEGNIELSFRTKLTEKLEDKVAKIPEEFPNYDSKQNTFLRYPILTPVKPVSNFHTSILGRHYRNVYLEKYDFKSLDLESFKGGLGIIKKGGGMQTNSLRLSNPDGREYVMRSLTKDVTRGIPYPFNKMKFIKFIFQDNYLATHPFGALAVPSLADAANVYHTNPSIYFVPKQDRLGIHNDLFGNEVYLVEERPGANWSDLKSFGYSKKMISTFKLVEKMQKNHKHHIDEKWVARSRLFDLMIGDWDRHDDQWRWTEVKDEHGHKLHRPIPRDRDQVFSKYDGALAAILSPFSSFVRQIANYKEELGNMKWVAYNTRHFDHYFLTELTLEDWIKEANYIQQNLADEVIDEALTHFPKAAADLSAERIKEVLKYRRDHLHETAKAFYKQLSKKVSIVGTEKRDLFEIIRQDDEHTSIKVYALSKNGEQGELHFSRIFNNTESKEVFLYGLGGDDKFTIEGNVSKGLLLRLVGGLGEDIIDENSKVSGLSKKTKIYDSKKGNEIDFGTEGKNKTSNITAHNVFDRKGAQFNENINVPLIIIGYNADDGFLMGLRTTSTRSGFFKDPYAQRHNLKFNFATATKGFSLDYSGEFIKQAGKWDFVVNFKGREHRYSFNYYGIGNETLKTSNDLDYNRVRQTVLYLDGGWQRRFAVNNGRFSIGPLIQFNDTEKTVNRFVSSDESDLSEEDFKSEFNGGIISRFEFENVDFPRNPKKGLHFKTSYSWQGSLNDKIRNFHKADGSFTLYASTFNKSRLTLATKLSAALITGDYNFYFAPSIGQDNGLRGFRPERFRGESSFAHMTDLRCDLFESKNNILPFSFGIHGGFDYGRVWKRNEVSNNWHYSYGGGLWIAPLDYILLSFGLYRSEEDDLFQFKIGHSF